MTNDKRPQDGLKEGDSIVTEMLITLHKFRQLGEVLMAVTEPEVVAKAIAEQTKSLSSGEARRAANYLNAYADAVEKIQRREVRE